MSHSHKFKLTPDMKEPESFQEKCNQAKMHIDFAGVLLDIRFLS